MSLLTIHPSDQPQVAEVIRDFDTMAAALGKIGVSFERWSADRRLPPDAGQDEILDTYRDPVERLKTRHGFQSADVIGVTPDHPHRAELRANFLNEHIHSDFEVRFFVEGRGLFYLHPDERVYVVLCEQGDLISVPANSRHWFDAGTEPRFTALRVFLDTSGWVPHYTGDDIAARFPVAA